MRLPPRRPHHGVQLVDEQDTSPLASVTSFSTAFRRSRTRLVLGRRSALHVKGDHRLFLSPQDVAANSAAQALGNGGLA